jgi:hypothetical protein
MCFLLSALLKLYPVQMLIRHLHLLCAGNIRYRVVKGNHFILRQRAIRIAMASDPISYLMKGPQSVLLCHKFVILSCSSLLEFGMFRQR